MPNHSKDTSSTLSRVIFMGTPDFAVPALRALVNGPYHVQAVVTQPDRPRGRGRKMVFSPVKKEAMGYGLEILQPERVSAPDFCTEVRNRTPDVLVVVAFGQILNQDLLNIPKWGVLNIHASLLPKYRGAAPIHWAILSNEDKTGLTAMKMEQGLDSGPILLQEEVPIFPDETAGQLHDRLAQLTGNFLIKSLRGIAEDRLRPTPQDGTKACYAPKIDRNLAFVKWEQSAQTVSALIRALDPWPGAYARKGGQEIKLYSSQAVDHGDVKGIPGRVIGFSEGGLEVETGDGVVRIRELQTPGKRRLPAKEFLRGFPIENGTILG